MIGIVGYGGYVPYLRLSRRAVVDANLWYAPHLGSKAKGARAMANWDEDSITMAVAAGRDCLGAADDRSHVRSVMLASCTLPFAERLNAAVICEALTLEDAVDAIEIGGSQRAALSALNQAVTKVRADGTDVLVLAADCRKSRAGSAQELDFGDGAAALLVGRNNVLAEYLGAATLTVDFVDHFRMAGEQIDYNWEERWIRDEGISKLMPKVILAALGNAGLSAEDIDHFILPTSFRNADRQVAAACGIPARAVADSLLDRIGETGVAHPLLVLARVLETAKPGARIMVAQFGSGGQALVFRVTDAINTFKPAKGVEEWLERGLEERNYTKFLSFKGQLELERGMRGEQDRKTALTTAYRHRSALLGLVAGRCTVTGSVHFPPSRISYDKQKPLQDTQAPYKLAERKAHVLSWSAEYLSFHRAPPHCYGQVDFIGGGRILMEFTDVSKNDLASGMEVEMAFRIKDIDERRNFTRYFWKATPVQRRQTHQAAAE